MKSRSPTIIADPSHPAISFSNFNGKTVNNLGYNGVSTRTRNRLCSIVLNDVIKKRLFKIHTKGKKVKVWFYIALYPVRWTAQSALHFLPSLTDLFIPTPFSASLGSILAMQQLRNDYSITFPPLSIARYSFIQLSKLRHREVKENAQTSKR